MSRIGKMPITIPKGVKVEWKAPVIKISGGKATLEREIHPNIGVSVDGDTIIVSPAVKAMETNALWGLSRSLINNMVVGVSEGFAKVLEVIGVGWRMEQPNPKVLKLSLGFSHPVEVQLPEGITAEIDAKTNKITLRGADKELLGLTAAKIRAYRKPEPYKGKGIRYEGEYVLRKVGKAGGK